MKYINRLLFLFYIIGSSCTDSIDTVGVASNKESDNICLSLSYAPLQESGSRTCSAEKGVEIVFGSPHQADTRATDDNKLENICILQFEGTSPAGNAVLKSMTYLDNPGARLQLSLVPSANSFLYLCANFGDVRRNFAIGYSTYQEVMDAALFIPDSDNVGTTVPMTGVSAGFNSMTQDTDLEVELARIPAKVSFTYDTSGLPSGATLNIAAVTLRNVPKSTSYIPFAADALTTTTEVISHLGTGTEVNASSKSYVWYIPENKRGNSTGDKAVTQWTERTESKAPIYATYIELTGTYTPYTGADSYNVTYVLYLGNGSDVNNYDVVRNHHYQIFAKIDGIDLSDLRISTDINLSADGLANCYLASKAGQWYRFNGTVRGNGNSEDYAASQYLGLSLLPSNVGSAPDAVTIPAAKVADAVVVWETTQGMINQVQWDASTGCVKFKTGTDTGMEEGNALIAVRNSKKEILWSWHIWRTSFDLVELNRSHTLKVKTNTKRAFYETAQKVVGMQREVIMMDRNIGAAGTTFEKNMGAYNIQYQFGRKDPFPAGASFSDEAPTGTAIKLGGDITLYGYPSDTPSKYSTYTIGGDTDSKIVDATTTGNTLSEVLNYTIMHPEKFFKTSEDSKNWIYTATLSSDDWKVSNCLWGDSNLASGIQNHACVDPNPVDGEKTIYDPSPAGWRVAPSDLLTAVADNFVVAWLNLLSAHLYVNGSWNYGWEIRFGMASNDPCTFLPASGFRSSTDGALYSAGIYGSTWFSCGAGQSVVLAAGTIYSSKDCTLVGERSRANAFPIRCVKE